MELTIKYSTRCLACGQPLVAGQRVFGEKDPITGKWRMKCLPCAWAKATPPPSTEEFSEAEMDTVLELAAALGTSVEGLEALAKESYHKVVTTWAGYAGGVTHQADGPADPQPMEDAPKLTPLQRLRREAAWCMEEES